MSARYNDAGSGPHDGAAREDGNVNCGCKHDGLRWIEFCDAARRGWQATHARAALEHANSQWDEVQK
jgi:hypothetical protein